MLSGELQSNLTDTRRKVNVLVIQTFQISKMPLSMRNLETNLRAALHYEP